MRETPPLGYAQPLKHSHPYLAISLPAYTMLRQRLMGHWLTAERVSATGSACGEPGELQRPFVNELQHKDSS